MSKEDFIRQEQEEEERKRRIKLLEERKAFQKLKRKFTKFIAANAETGRFEPIHHFLDKERYPMRYKAKKIVAGYLSFQCGKNCAIKVTQKEMVKLLKMELDLLEDKLLSIETVRNTILGFEEDMDE